MSRPTPQPPVGMPQRPGTSPPHTTAISPTSASRSTPAAGPSTLSASRRPPASTASKPWVRGSPRRGCGVRRGGCEVRRGGCAVRRWCRRWFAAVDARFAAVRGVPRREIRDDRQNACVGGCGNRRRQRHARPDSRRPGTDRPAPRPRHHQTERRVRHSRTRHDRVRNDHVEDPQRGSAVPRNHDRSPRRGRGRAREPSGLAGGCPRDAADHLARHEQQIPCSDGQMAR